MHPVADLGRGRDHLELPVVAGVRATATAGGEQRQRGCGAGHGHSAPRHSRDRLPDRHHREDRARDAGDRRPRGGVGLDREPESHRSLEGDQADAGQLPTQHPPGEEPRGDRRDDEQRSNEQSPDNGQSRGCSQRDQPQQGSVEQPCLPAAAPGRGRFEALRQPALADQRGRGQRRDGGEGGEGDVTTADQEQAAEQQRLDVGAGTEDVAGEDHPGGETADKDERDHAVPPLVATPAEDCIAGSEGDRSAEGAERRREAEPVGEHQPREGGGADRM